jgi:hypothetical protein
VLCSLASATSRAPRGKREKNRWTDPRPVLFRSFRFDLRFLFYASRVPTLQKTIRKYRFFKHAHAVTTKYPKPFPRSICNLFSQKTSGSHDNLRRVSKSPLLHPFTCYRSGTLDWHVMRATSADSSRLIHSIFGHSSSYTTLSFNLLSL